MATPPWLGTASLFILLAAYFPSITCAATKDASDPQLVRLRYVQGDVRFNRGDGKHPDLKRPWEVAITNLPIAGGKASFVVPNLSVGTHNITATYNGDSNYGPSSSAALVQAVN